MGMRWIAGFLGLMACFSASSAAQAVQQNIGATETVKNEVSREIGGAAGKLNSGDPVFRNEVVKTGQEATAKLVFLDSTNLAVGPISRVVLDRFVFDGGDAGQTVAVKLAKGLFRFTTGALDKNAYSVTTPTAAIGVRGTILDISVNGPHNQSHSARGAGDRMPGGEGRRLRAACARLHSRQRQELRLHRARPSRRDRAGLAQRRRSDKPDFDASRGEF